MPIPTFRSDGRLPEGVYPVTWSEITRSYGSTPRRLEMLDGLRRALRELSSVGCRVIWIDGGFVTKSLSPKDYDCCYDTHGMNLADFRRRYPILSNTDRNEEQKDHYKGEFYAASTTSFLGTKMFDFFQLTHRIPRNLIPPHTVQERDLVRAMMQNKKGILELRLTPRWEER